MKTAFRDIRDELRRRIIANEWPPGGLIPNEVDLCAEFNCARATVNRAMRELAEEGLIERRRKAGTRVRDVPRKQATFEVPVVRKEIEARGSRYQFTLLSREAMPAPAWLCARLEIPDNSPVLHLTCLHCADGHPYQFEDRWINLKALPQAKQADFSNVGPNEWLLATVPYTDAQISFGALNSDPDLAHHLGCKAGDALFVAERMTSFQDEPITYVRMIHQRGHQMTMRY
ncbi:putative HTH-type transcriptional regulator YurK [Roseovarius albus]|uniref:Putative HTH-type transcriptional regulator YurK n=1 Tax=Roseovarius albus TaxID=1247867 RepID=A0A1X7A555_9RHOB|nr:GntR family transcriptional regulator [Roseovarius albus]SLN70901.1 putative HTH-type transcriptional regulator YurK [Roseovarius albus]